MELILIILIAYLLGSIPSALWIGKLFYKVDVREHGSGNLGATNTFRVLGKKAGIVVTVFDILKGTAATLLVFVPLFDSISIHQLVLGAFAVIGHTYPVFARFKGGKAVATSGGVLLGYNWPVFLVILGSFLILLKLSKMVSFSSMAVSVVAVVYSIIYYIRTDDYSLIIMTSLFGSFIFYRHRDNIKRIKAGTESKISWF